MCCGWEDLAAELDSLIAQVAAYEHGQSREPLARLDAILRQPGGSPEMRRQVEQRLIRLIEGKATAAGIDAACRRLSEIGSARAVPALARLLASPQAFDSARYALERIPVPEAARALRQALPKLSGGWRIGVINALAAKRDARAVPLLVRLAQGADPQVAAAAVAALGRIGTEQACTAAEKLRVSQAAVAARLLDARLTCAAEQTRRGERSAAFRAYQRLYAAENPLPVRVAALKGMAGADGRRALEALAAALQSKEEPLRAQAVWSLARTKESTGPALLASHFGEWPPRTQAQAVYALAERGAPSARAAFLEAAKSPVAEVQVAALDALGRHGDASVVGLLAAAALSGAEPQATAARRALVTLSDPGVDEAIILALSGADPKLKLELIRAAGDRGASAASQALIAASRDPNREVRREALRALVNTAEAPELGALAELVARPVSPAELREAQRTLSFVLQRLSRAPVDAVIAACRKAEDPDARAALMLAMAQSGRSEFLPILREALRSEDSPTRRGAIVALAEWPRPEMMPDLLETARKDPSPALRTLALRSYIRLVGLPSQRSRAESASLLAEALKLAAQPEEKKAILGLLVRFACPEALAVAEEALQDASLAAEAGTAAESIRKALQAER